LPDNRSYYLLSYCRQNHSLKKKKWHNEGKPTDAAISGARESMPDDTRDRTKQRPRNNTKKSSGTGKTNTRISINYKNVQKYAKPAVARGV